MNIELIKASADMSAVITEVDRVNATLERQTKSLKDAQAALQRVVNPYNNLEVIMGRLVSRTVSTAGAFDRMRESLGGQSQAAARTTTSLTGLATMYSKGAAAAEQYAAANRNAATAKDRSTVATNTNVVAAKQLVAAQTEAAAATNNLSRRVKEADTNSKGLLLSWESLVRLLTVQILHQTVSLLSQHLRRAITDATELQLKLAEIRVISTDLTKSTSDWGAELRVVSELYGAPMHQIAEAAYQTISNQIAQGTEAVEFVKQASMLAMAAVGTQTDAVNALAAVINAYRMNIDKADKISAKLLETIKLGRVRLVDLGNDLGQVTPIAAQLGVSIDDLLAQIASLTRLGMSSSEAVTQLRNIFIKLIIPTKEMRKLFQEMGVSSGRELIHTMGDMGKAYEAMMHHTQGNVEVTTDLIQRIRGLGAVMEFTDRRGLKRLQDYIQAIEGSTEAYKQRAEEILQSHAIQWRQITTAMRNTFLLDVGPKMLKSVLTLDQAVGGLNNRLQDLIRFMQISAIPVIGLLVIKFGLLVKAHVAMSGIIGAITIASVVINKVMAAQQQEIEENTKKWTRYGIEAGKALATTTRELEQLLASTQAQIDSTFTALKGEIEDSMEESGKDVSKFAGLLEEEFRNSTEHAKNKIKDLQAEIESLGRIQENINSAITGMRLRTEDQMFRFLLDDAGIEQQADLWLNQIKKIEEELQQAFNLGDHVDLQRLTGELDKALLAYRKLQKDIIAENKKTHEMRVDLINKEEELRGRARITKDRGERSGIMAQADELRRQLESLRLIEVPNLNIPDRYLRSMQDVESKLRDLRNQARKEEEKAIVRLAKEERRQNEMTAIQKQLQDLNLLEIITKELTGDLRKRELHIQEVKRIAGTVEDRADRLRELSKEGGFDTEVMEKLARQQSETLIAHLASIEEHHRATTAQERATEFVENMSDNIAGLAEEIEKHKQVMDKIGLFTIDLERSLETDRKVIQALGMGGMLMSGDTSEVSRVARSEPVLERMKEELERRAAVVQFLQNELESRQRLMNQAEEWAKGETVARDKVTKSFNAINSEGAVLIIRFQRLQKMFQNLESQGRAALSGPNVTGNRKFGGASYGSEGRYLTPGEFVMSGGATRRMFNQLLTTNSATSAASGSSVNVGDINITMQTHGNVNYDGRRLVNQIRREIRQGSLAV